MKGALGPLPLSGLNERLGQTPGIPAAAMALLLMTSHRDSVCGHPPFHHPNRQVRAEGGVPKAPALNQPSMRNPAGLYTQQPLCPVYVVLGPHCAGSRFPSCALRAGRSSLAAVLASDHAGSAIARFSCEEHKWEVGDPASAMPASQLAGSALMVHIAELQPETEHAYCRLPSAVGQCKPAWAAGSPGP